MIGTNLPHAMTLASQDWAWWLYLLLAIGCAITYVFGGALIIASLNAMGFYGDHGKCTCRKPHELFCHNCDYNSYSRMLGDGHCRHDDCDWDNGWRIAVLLLWPCAVPIALAAIPIALVAALGSAMVYVTRGTAVKLGNGVGRIATKGKELHA